MAGAGDVLQVVDGAVVLRVHVQPRARRPRVGGQHGGALKIAVTAPPTGGRANDAVLDLLASELGVARRSLSLAGGASSRRKRVRVEGIDVGTLRAILGQLGGTS